MFPQLDQIRGSKPAKAPQPKKSTRKTTETQSKSMDEANAAHLTESPTLKEAVFDVLCESNIEGIPRLHIVSALLKTVVGPDLDGALRKAWTVACGDAAGRAMAEQVACVVSGGATDAPGGSGCHVGRVRELVEEASAKEGGEGEEEEGEEEADEEEEKEEAKLSMADIMGAEAGPAWTLRQMVGWYKWVDLEAVLGREEAEEGEEAEGGGEGEGDGEQGEVGEEGEEGEE